MAVSQLCICGGTRGHGYGGGQYGLTDGTGAEQQATDGREAGLGPNSICDYEYEYSYETKFLNFYSSIRIRDVSEIPSVQKAKFKRQGSFLYLLSWKCAGTRA